MMSEYSVSCQFCGGEASVPDFGRINVKENPELRSKVKDGSAFVWECPHCGKKNLVRTPVLYHDPDNGTMIYFLPPGGLDEGQEAALAEQGKALSVQLPDYVLRRVDDIGSLIEKANIFDTGLDDCVIEMCKYVTKMEMAEKVKDDNILSAGFKFCGIEGADNDLVFAYPKDGSMQCLKTGFNVYEDCAGIIGRNPSMKPSEGFARIDPSWVAEFFR